MTEDPSPPVPAPVHGSPLGSAFAHALARKDFAAVEGILHPDVDFRGMTPSRFWEATSASSVIDEVLRLWFEETDEIEALERMEADALADRRRVAYRLRVRNPEGSFVVEQQAYYAERDGRIGWMRVLCSGFRPRPPDPAGVGG